MTRPRRLIVCLAAVAAIGLVLAGFGAQRLQAQGQAKAEKTAVAVVNVGDLIAKCQKNISFQADIAKRRNQLQIEAAEKEKAIKLMQADLEVIVDAQSKSAKERQIIEAIAQYRSWSQIQQEYMNRDQRLFLIELYGDIDKTVAAVAEREGYDLVLFDTPTPDFDELNPEQLVAAIGSRRIIYRSDRVNLTPVVLEQMNLDHLNRGGN